MKMDRSIHEQDVSKILLDWEKFYRKYFDLVCNFSNLVIPERPTQGKWRLIVVAEGMTPQKLFNKCLGQFDAHSCIGDDLNNISDKVSKNYSFWVRAIQEVDENLRNLSADDLKQKSIIGITFIGRLLFELKYFDETEMHLDIEHFTLCTASRCLNGLIPSVHWHGDKIRVLWYSPSDRHDLLGSRSVVLA